MHQLKWTVTVSAVYFIPWIDSVREKVLMEICNQKKFRDWRTKINKNKENLKIFNLYIINYIKKEETRGTRNRSDRIEKS